MGAANTWRRVRAAAFFAAVCAAAGTAHAFRGSIEYTGALGPIGARRPLCICVYRNPDLTSSIGCIIGQRNRVAYDTGDLLDRDYYAVAFVDLIINERRDASEPYVIYAGRLTEPADPINGVAVNIDFVFGDEGLAATPTATAALEESPTPTATAAGTPPATLAGDCDDNGSVSVDELVRAVGIALESVPLASCTAADRDGDGVVRIEELIAALNAALAT